LKNWGDKPVWWQSPSGKEKYYSGQREEGILHGMVYIPVMYLTMARKNCRISGRPYPYQLSL
jgi:hypothetical protein